MLEYPALWIGPEPETADSTCWLIREAASGQPLGLARPRRPAKSPWRRWLSWPTLEVCESDDEALLFTLDRYWGVQATWIVRDADERDVGRLRGRSAWDPQGRLIGQLQLDGQGQARWRAPDGQELAAIQVEEDASVLAFYCADNPFTRMVLLAGLLRR